MKNHFQPERSAVVRKAQARTRNIWIKAETFDGERRTPLTPMDAAALISMGMVVSVEKSDMRIFPDRAYVVAGCKLVEQGSWQASAPPHTVVLGIKYLDPVDRLDTHYPIRNKTLIHWAHAFDGDPQEQHELSRIEEAGYEHLKNGSIQRYPALLDLETMENPDGSRIFTGLNAGICGAAMGIAVWLQKQAGQEPPYEALRSFDNKEQLAGFLKVQLASVRKSLPHLCIIGAHGKAGHGAAWLCDYLGLKQTPLGREQMKAGALTVGLDVCDVILNCTSPGPLGSPPFLTDRILQDHQRSLVFVDIASYPSIGPMRFANYKYLGTWGNPTFRRRGGAHSVDLISIDNLPNIIAKEASASISAILRPVLPAFFESREKNGKLPQMLLPSYNVMKEHVDYACEVKDLAWQVSLQSFDGHGQFSSQKAMDIVARWAEKRKEVRPTLEVGERNLFQGYFMDGFKQVRDIRGGNKGDALKAQLSLLDYFTQSLDIGSLYASVRTNANRTQVKKTPHTHASLPGHSLTT